MCSYYQAAVVVLLVCAGTTSGIQDPSLNHEYPELLPALVKPQMLERLQYDTNGHFTYECGHWCDAEMASLRQAIAEQLNLAPIQLGDIRLREVLQGPFAPDPSWDGIAIAYVTKPNQTNGMHSINADGRTTEVDHEDMLGSVVVVPSGSEAIFSSRVKLMIIPVLHQARPFYEYYISSWLWQNMVPMHCAGSFLGLDFFKAHTEDPLFWHATVWVALGSAALAFLAMPLVWRYMLNLVDTIEARMDSQETDSATLPRGPTLLEKLRSGEQPCMPFEFIV